MMAISEKCRKIESRERERPVTALTRKSTRRLRLGLHIRRVTFQKMVLGGDKPGSVTGSLATTGGDHLSGTVIAAPPQAIYPRTSASRAGLRHNARQRRLKTSLQA